MWQPIETAPRNQTFLAVLNCAGEQRICTMRWPVAEAKNTRPDSKAFHVERVTHWMPLPDLPGAQPAPSVPEDVMRDAERYRYLRGRDDSTAGVGCWLEAGGKACACGWLNGDRLDRAIDCAIEALAAAPEAKP